MLTLFSAKTWIILLFIVLMMVKNNEKNELKKFYRFNSHKNILSNHYPERIKKLPLTSSVLFGQKRYLKKKYKESFKKIGIYHLMTPSGLHLQIIFSLLSFIFFFLKNNKTLIILFSPLLFFEKFYSIKRVLILRSLKLLPNLRSIKIRFALIILYDIFSGNLNQSWMSSLFSFTALSIILFTKEPLKRVVEFFFFQVIINIYFGTKVYLLSFFISPLLTSLSIFILPILIINFFFLQSEMVDQKIINFFMIFELNADFIDELTPLFLLMMTIKYLWGKNFLKSKRALAAFLLLYSV